MSNKLTPGKALVELLRNSATTWMLVLFAQHLEGTLRTLAWVLAGFYGMLTFFAMGGLGIALERFNKEHETR